MGGVAHRRRKRKEPGGDRSARQKEEQARQEKQLQGKLVGSDNAEDAKDKDEKEAAPEVPEQGDHQGLSLGRHHRRARPRQAGRQLSRSPQEPGGGSSQLSAARPAAADAPTRRYVDEVGERFERRRTYKVLDNLPEVDEELAPDDVRPNNLVDPLPFLKAGLWEKVHIASLVPKEKKEIPKSDTAPGGGMMGGWHDGRHDESADGDERGMSMGQAAAGLGGGMMSLRMDGRR